MNTTNLFVELVVIGVSALSWVILLVLSVFGWDWVPTERVFSTTALVPLVSLVYILGVVSDRIADTLFELWWSDKLRGKYFPNLQEYHAARRIVLTRSERFSDLLEYGRSRLRICRGWALNCVLIVVFLDLFIWIKLSGSPLALHLYLCGTIGGLLFAVASWYSWRKLTMTEYRKVKEQAAYLAAQEGRVAKGGV